MKEEQVFLREHTARNGQICRMEIKLYKNILTICQRFIDGKISVVVLSGNEELQALKKMLRSVK